MSSRREAANTKVPVVIVAGELDRVDPVAVVKEHVASHYPSAKVHFLPNKGHLLPVEAPAEVATTISEFAKSFVPSDRSLTVTFYIMRRRAG